MPLTFAPGSVMLRLGMNWFSKYINYFYNYQAPDTLPFAMLNWMAKGVIIGGIYSRPIVIANLAHFLIGDLELIKAVIHPG